MFLPVSEKMCFPSSSYIIFVSCRFTFFPLYCVIFTNQKSRIIQSSVNGVHIWEEKRINENRWNHVPYHTHIHICIKHCIKLDFHFLFLFWRESVTHFGIIVSHKFFRFHIPKAMLYYDSSFYSFRMTSFYQHFVRNTNV